MQVNGENLDSYVNLQTTAETVVYWTIGGYVLFALWLVYFVGIFCVCDRIALCITIIRNSSQYLLRAIMIPNWLFLPAVFRPFWTVFPGLGAGFLNLAGQTERTAKKRGKNEQKWARNGLRRVGVSGNHYCPE